MTAEGRRKGGTPITLEEYHRQPVHAPNPPQRGSRRSCSIRLWRDFEGGGTYPPLGACAGCRSAEHLCTVRGCPCDGGLAPEDYEGGGA